MKRHLLAAVLLACAAAAWDQHATGAGQAQDATDPEAVSELDALMQSLFASIAALSDYGVPARLPRVFHLPQLALEARICDEPCNVTAAYLPREGIFLSENLDPIRDPLDRAALVHELVHYLQQGHPKFAGLAPCVRERTKEQEAYAIHNAYLAAIRSTQRVVFYEGDFECDGETQPPTP